MKNKISHIKITLLNIGFISFIIGVAISFVEIFCPLLSYSFNSKAFKMDLICSIISFSILILINIFLPILSYINLNKHSKKISVIVLILCLINICFNIFFVYIILNNLPIFPITFLFIDTMFAGVLFVFFNNVIIAYFAFLVSTSLFLITTIFSIKNHISIN